MIYPFSAILDFQGNIVQFRNKPPEFPDNLIDTPFINLINERNHSEFRKMLQQIHEKKIILTTDIKLKDFPKSKPYLIIALTHDQLLVTIDEEKTALFKELYKEMLSINNEQLNIIRDLQKKLSVQSDKRKPESNKIYEQLISTNNELANIQRHLAKKNAELEEALKKVKLLSGLIPICASCKRIRDDGGYWNQVEKYISEHSNAQFSHGLCPDCMQKLYPEFVKKKED